MPLKAVITRITQKLTGIPLTRYPVVHLLMIHCYQQNKLLARPDLRLESLSLLPTPVITKSALHANCRPRESNRMVQDVSVFKVACDLACNCVGAEATKSCQLLGFNYDDDACWREDARHEQQALDTLLSMSRSEYSHQTCYCTSATECFLSHGFPLCLPLPIISYLGIDLLYDLLRTYYTTVRTYSTTLLVLVR